MSLFDKAKPVLSPALFNPDDTFRQDVRLYLLQQINQIMVPGTVVGVFLLGSMAGRQYNEESDIDINLILRDGLQLDDFKEHVKSFNDKFLPETRHPVNYHLQEYSEPNYANTSEYAVYDLMRDVWAVPPKSYEEIRDPDDEFRDEINYAKMYASVLNTTKYKQELFDRLERRRKEAYSFGWGTPRESQQNILYKFIEKLKTKH